jgi:tripartite-type tricarboxylate transporter receptor subunit TctC
MVEQRFGLVAIAAAALCVLAAAAPAAESYPNRLIKIVVPFPPGAPSDLVSRAIADGLSAKLRQPVIVENRPGGAGGTLGALVVATAQSDGYTLLLSPPGPLVTAAAIYKNVGYDPAKSFSPIAKLFKSPHLLVANPSVPATSIQELAAYAKRNPGKISFASPGYGTQPHLLGEMFNAAAEINMVHVLYKGPAALVTDLVAGRINISFLPPPSVLPQAEAGKLRLVAVAGEGRLPQSPDKPTAIESGFAHLSGDYWAGIVAPAGTPEPIIGMLNATINDIMQSQDIQVALGKLGAQASLGSPHEFSAFLDAERLKWSSIIHDAGIKID